MKQTVTIDALEDDHLPGAATAVAYSPGDVPRRALREQRGRRRAALVQRDQSYQVWSYAPRADAEAARAHQARLPAPPRSEVPRGRPAASSCRASARPTARRADAAALRRVPATSQVYRPLYRKALDIAGSAKTPYAAAVALEAWFRTSGELHLRRARRRRCPACRRWSGSCTQTHSGLLPALRRRDGADAAVPGRPARVAAGFTSGKYDADKRDWTVTDHDAHAWVEVWFRGWGWLPFDPTPSRGELSGVVHDRVADVRRAARRCSAAALDSGAAVGASASRPRGGQPRGQRRTCRGASGGGSGGAGARSPRTAREPAAAARARARGGARGSSSRRSCVVAARPLPHAGPAPGRRRPAAASSRTTSPTSASTLPEQRDARTSWPRSCGKDELGVDARAFADALRGGPLRPARPGARSRRGGPARAARAARALAAAAAARARGVRRRSCPLRSLGLTRVIRDAVVMAAGEGTPAAAADRALAEAGAADRRPAGRRDARCASSRRPASSAPGVVTGHLAEQVERARSATARAFGLERRFVRQPTRGRLRRRRARARSPPAPSRRSSSRPRTRVFTPGDLARFAARGRRTSTARSPVAPTRRRDRGAPPLERRGRPRRPRRSDDPAQDGSPARRSGRLGGRWRPTGGLPGPPYELADAFQRAIDEGSRLPGSRSGRRGT